MTNLTLAYIQQHIEQGRHHHQHGGPPHHQEQEAAGVKQKVLVCSGEGQSGTLQSQVSTIFWYCPKCKIFPVGEVGYSGPSKNKHKICAQLLKLYKVILKHCP